MDEIIREIIEIDKEADERLKKALEAKDEVVKKQIVVEKEELRRRMELRAEHHLNSVRDIERKNADDAVEKLEAIKQNELQQLALIYQNNHEKWETDIVNRIIGR